MKNICLRIKFSVLVCLIALALSVISLADGEIELLAVAAKAAQPQAVTDKVNELVEECRNAGLTDEYDIALWFHDWLTANANYDYTYTIYTPSGVLLEGTGVCQSYSEAYELLLTAVGIENMVVYAPEMDHAWNLVKLGGEWCHIDCTWDDPGTGGQENHNYFGLNDELISRDHKWNTANYPAATSLKNFYIVKSGIKIFSDLQEMDTVLSELVTAKTQTFEIYYIGTDNDFNIFDEFNEWYGKNNWKYGLGGYSINGNEFSLTITIPEYVTPWEKPAPLAQPIEGTAFSLTGVNGIHTSSAYADTGIIMIFGQTTCGNTANLLSNLEEQIASLDTRGIKVIVNLLDCDDVTAVQNSDFAKTYTDVIFTVGDQYLLWDNLGKVDFDSIRVSLPVVFVYGHDNMITYYSTGAVLDMDGFLDIVYDSVPELEPAPEPEPEPVEPGEVSVYGDVDGDGNVTNKDSAIVARHLARWTGYDTTNLQYNFAAADVDGDGFVTNKDSAIIARHLARWQGYESLPKAS